MSLVNSIFEIKASISYPYNSSATWSVGGQILDSNNNVISSFSEIVLTRNSISHSGGHSCGGGGLGSTWGPYTTYDYYIKFGSTIWSQKDLSSSSSHDALTGPGVTRVRIISDNGGVAFASWLANNATKINTEVDLTQYTSLEPGEHTLVVKSKATGYYTSAASNSVTYVKYCTLSAPEISTAGSQLIIEDVEHANSYDIYDGDNFLANFPVGGVIMPVKGDLITMNVDGTDKQFRVLNVNGNVAEVLMMTSSSTSQTFGSTQTYAGSALDTYLNSTWYDTLTSTAKTAIVDKTFTQDSWYWGNSGNPDYSGYYGTTNPGTSAYTISLGNAAFGSSITRHVYALSVQDVLDYVLDTSITDGQLQNYNIWKMFWNDKVQHTGPTNYLWLRSARASSSSYAFLVAGNFGTVGTTNVENSNSVRPAFTIDLSKITWSEVNS